MTTSVTISGCSYLVTDNYGKTHTVSKDKTCSCGNDNCWHIRQVKQYLNDGGERAPELFTDIDISEVTFRGLEKCTVPTREPEPYRNPYTLRYWAERVAKLKTFKAIMDSDGSQNTLSAKAQYWHDLVHGVDVQKKWNLNEPSFPVSNYVKL